MPPTCLLEALDLDMIERALCKLDKEACCRTKATCHLLSNIGRRILSSHPKFYARRLVAKCIDGCFIGWSDRLGYSERWYASISELNSVGISCPSSLIDGLQELAHHHSVLDGTSTLSFEWVCALTIPDEVTQAQIISGLAGWDNLNRAAAGLVCTKANMAKASDDVIAEALEQVDVQQWPVERIALLLREWNKIALSTAGGPGGYGVSRTQETNLCLAFADRPCFRWAYRNIGAAADASFWCACLCCLQVWDSETRVAELLQATLGERVSEAAVWLDMEWSDPERLGKLLRLWANTTELDRFQGSLSKSVRRHFLRTMALRDGYSHEQPRNLAILAEFCALSEHNVFDAHITAFVRWLRPTLDHASHPQLGNTYCLDDIHKNVTLALVTDLIDHTIAVPSCMDYRILLD